MEEKNIQEENNFTKEIIDFFKDLVIIVVIVKVITIFLVSIFIINGQSMYASYYDKEFILVDRFSAHSFWWLKKQNIYRWDVVVVRPEVDPSKEYFIKRVIWLPWETLKIKDGWVYIKKVGDNKFIKLDEKYLTKNNYWHTFVSHSPKEMIYHIPKDKFFVMWDNRTASSDSRSCFSFTCTGIRDNYITKNEIVWKVLLDLGYFNFRNFSFKHPGSRNYPELKGIDTHPKWLNTVSHYNY